MRNPFPMETGFYGLVRNTGCLDKSNLSCSICICIRRQRSPSLMPGTSRSRVPFEIRVFANTPPRFTPLYPSVSPHLFISLRFRVLPLCHHRHPLRCEKRPLHRTYYEFSIVLLNFVSLISTNRVLTDTRTLHRIRYLTRESHR